MFLSARTCLIVLAILLLTALAVPAAVFAGPRALQSSVHRPAAPTPKQIRTALRRAERSRDLWATVNICNTARNPGILGIRGQMPALGFNALLTMQVQASYWSVADHQFKPVPDTRRTISLGRAHAGLHQSGLSFAFSPHAGRFAGTIRFDWRIGGRSIGHVTRWTSAHHRDADRGDPSHYSEAKCEIS